MPAQRKPKKPGRPKLAKGDAKAVMLRVRISPAEAKAVMAKARASKQSVSEWTRSKLMDFNMTEEDWKKVQALFSKARDGYAKAGVLEMADQCETAIGLVSRIALDPRL